MISPPFASARRVVILSRDSIEAPSTPRVPAVQTTVGSVCFDEVFNTVYVAVREGLGPVSVAITHTSTNESFDMSVPGGTTGEIVISGTTGMWCVTITRQNGAVYSGSFEIIAPIHFEYYYDAVGNRVRKERGNA